MFTKTEYYIFAKKTFGNTVKINLIIMKQINFREAQLGTYEVLKFIGMVWIYVLLVGGQGRYVIETGIE